MSKPCACPRLTRRPMNGSHLHIGGSRHSRRHCTPRVGGAPPSAAPTAGKNVKHCPCHPPHGSRDQKCCRRQRRLQAQRHCEDRTVHGQRADADRRLAAHAFPHLDDVERVDYGAQTMGGEHDAIRLGVAMQEIARATKGIGGMTRRVSRLLTTSVLKPRSMNFLIA